MLDRLFRRRTGRGIRAWFLSVEKSIQSYQYEKWSTTSQRSGWLGAYFITDTAMSMYKILGRNWDSIIRDSNIENAYYVSLLLVLWVFRVLRSKARDPRRDKKFRQHAMQLLNAYQHALVDCMADDGKDRQFFPEQEWSVPELQTEEK